MIGGTDVVLPARGDPAALDACARVIRRFWPQARFEDAVTGDKYPSYGDIPFGQVQQLLIYHDEHAEAAWDADRADSPPNSMLYVILSEDFVTIVVDNPDAPDLRALLESVREILQMNMLCGVGV